MSTEPTQRRKLRVIYDQIATRAESIADTRPPSSPWPCRSGCDGCCRRLARAPELTRAEWLALWRGFLRLDAAARGRVRAQVDELRAAREGQHVVCPLLDRDAGMCMVYDERPAACRMYGFYVVRGEGRYCQQIADEVDAGRCDDVIWGNQYAIERTLEKEFGAAIAMTDWFAAHPEDDPNEP